MSKSQKGIKFNTSTNLLNNFQCFNQKGKENFLHRIKNGIKLLFYCLTY